MAGNEASARLKKPESNHGLRPSPAPITPRPTPIAAVPGPELDALDRAAADIRPSWMGASPSAPSPAVTPEPAAEPSPSAEIPGMPPVAAPVGPHAELGSHADPRAPTSGVLPSAPAAASEAEPARVSPIAAAALYYGSDPAPRRADATQPMPPILLPTPWAQLTDHPVTQRLLTWRAQHPSVALGAAALLVLLLLLAAWPSAEPRARPAPLPPPAPGVRNEAPVEPPGAALPATAVEPTAPAEPAEPPAAPAAKPARKTLKKARDSAARTSAPRAAPVAPKVAPKAAPIKRAAEPVKKAPEPAKPGKARAPVTTNPYL
jgi:hypothetical protein